MVVAGKIDRPSSPLRPTPGAGEPGNGARRPGEAAGPAKPAASGRDGFRNARDRAALRIERILLGLPKLPLP